MNGWKTFARSLARLAVFAAVATTVPGAQELQEVENDNPRARMEWLEQDRKYPLADAPPGARMEALRELDVMLSREARASRTASANGAAPPPPASSTQWTFIGPRPTGTSSPTAGRVPALALDPSNPQVVYAGAAQGGVWKTTDGGANWTPLTDDQASLAMGAIAVAPSNTSIVYAGTGELSFSSSSYYGAGVLKSVNGGATWTQTGSPAGAPFAGPFSSGLGGMYIGGMAIHPSDPNVVFVSARRFSNSGSGIYRTTDGGNNWTEVLLTNPNTGAGMPAGSAIQYRPGITSVLYAGFGNTGSSAGSAGMWRSTDGGTTWSQLGGGLPTSNVGRVEFTISVSNPMVMYVAIQDTGEVGGSFGALLGLYKSTDGGDTWTKLTATPDFCSPQCWYDMVVAVSPVNPNLIFAGGISMYRSSDGGSTWETEAAGLHVDQHAMAFSPDGSRLYLGNDGGVYRADNPAAAATSGNDIVWTNLNSTLGITQFYWNIAIHPTDVNVTFGGTQDNGTQKYSGDMIWQRATCGDGASAIIDPQNPSFIYTNCQNIDVRRSSTGGAAGTFTNITGSLGSGEPVEFIPPMVGDINDGRKIYFGTNRLWRTTDATAGTPFWEAISGDVSGGGRIRSIGISPSDPETIYTGSTVGRVFSTRNASAVPATFTDVSAGLPGRRISDVAVHATTPTTAVVTLTGFNASGIVPGHVFLTTNGGQSWTNISGNLPNSPVNAVVIDPDLLNTYYVGNDVGVFQTRDDGATWQTLVAGLPRVAVLDLAFHRPTRTLRAATHGRGMWDTIIPGPTPELQFDPTLAFGNVVLGTNRRLSTVLRSGTVSVNITSITSGSNGEFPITHNCPSTLAGNSSCTVTMTFTPALLGARSTSLTVTTNATGSPHVISVTGTGSDFQFTRLRRPSRPTSSTSATVSAAAPAQVELELAGTVDAPVELSCAGAPAGVRCNFNPKIVLLSGDTKRVQLEVSVAQRLRLSRSASSRMAGKSGREFVLRVNAKAGSAVRTIELPLRTR